MLSFRACSVARTLRFAPQLSSRFCSKSRNTSPNGSSSNSRLVALSSIPKEDLGHCILYCKDTLPPGSLSTSHDIVAKGVFGAKLLSLSSSIVGAVMVPVLSKYMWEAAAERPSMMLFVVVANTFLVLLSFTPLLLHFLAKRFPVRIYYNNEKKLFTSVHYDFLIRKRAHRFTAEDVVDAQVAPEMKKVWIPLATAFIHKKPVLLSLDKKAYIDQFAFEEMTKNVNIPENHD